MSDTREEKRVGRRTDAEIKAEGKAEAEAEIEHRMEAFEKRMEKKMAAQQQNHDAHLATVTAAAKTQGAIPTLKQTNINTGNDIVRGVAHATGGASHEEVEDENGNMVPWTPECPDWVYSNYGGLGGPEYMGTEEYGRPLTQDGHLAEYLYKQAYLNDIRMTQEMLPEAMEGFKDRGDVPRLTAPQADNASLAAAAVL